MNIKKFNTFEGVFTPCLLSILGVIMYLRLGWVVGSVGFFGTFIIIVLSNMITFFTTLSMSSIVTNIRIGAGGAYSIISKSLGIQIGGAIGIPLFLSQAISVAFYITGFSESWLFVFPLHNPLLVSLIAWFVILIVSYLSTQLAFKLQFIIMGLIGVSLVSIFMTNAQFNISPGLIAKISSANFWQVFAIFFPAVTGILAGASMSGELEDPKKSIPIGTLFAIIISFMIYCLLAYWYSIKVPASVLINNNSVALDIGRFKWAVIAGMMGATLSSALGMFVGAPRVFLALCRHKVLPYSDKFTTLSKKGEPTTAILFTSLIALITILFGSLDKIASLLTMFFLITYGMINLTVFIEQSIGIVSFRPTFRIPKLISFLGAIGCLFVMLLIDFKFSIIAIVIILIIYFILLKKGSAVYSPDVRSGMLVYLAEKFALSANKLPYYPKIWKPNLLFFVKDIERFRYVLPFVKSIILPAGRLIVLKMIDKSGKKLELVENEKQETKKEIESALVSFKEEGLFVEDVVLSVSNLDSSFSATIQLLTNMFFPPNTFFYMLNLEAGKQFQFFSNKEFEIDESIIQSASIEGLGIIILIFNSTCGFGEEKIINLWIRRQSPNVNLAILTALQLKRNWEDSNIRILHVINDSEERSEVEDYLDRLKQLMRLPVDIELCVIEDSFPDVLSIAPKADINIFGMQDKPDFSIMEKIANSIDTSVLFLKDSSHESALA